jgi:hypothetical protein
VTQGPTKALVCTPAGIPGIGLHEGSCSERTPEVQVVLRTELRHFEFGGRTVYICFDADIDPKVRHASIWLFLLLNNAGAKVYQLTSWDLDQGKGIDDFIVASTKDEPGESAGNLLTLMANDATRFIDTIEPNKVDLDSVVAELVAVELGELYKAQLCKELAKRLKVPAPDLHKVVQDTSDDVHSFSFEKTSEPWQDPVDGSQLLHALSRLLVRHVAIDESGLTAISLWIVLTYVINEVEVLPILGITSPEKRCGKTRLLTVLGWLVQKPLPASNISTAAIYRVIEQSSPTLLVDEADTYLDGDDEMRGVINSGHTKHMAFVLRASANGGVQRYSTWAAKAIAMIGQLSPTLADRSIPVHLARRTKAETVHPLRNTKRAEVETLRRKIVRWTNDYREEIAFANPVPPNVNNDRAADNWNPLLKIAQVAGGDWPALALKALTELNAVEHDEDSITAVLLVSLGDAFEEEKACHPDGFVATDAILARLNENSEAPWADWRNGQGLSAKKLGEILRPFGVKSVVRRTDPADPKSRRNGYDWEKIFPVLERYVPGHLTQNDSPSQKRF